MPNKIYLFRSLLVVFAFYFAGPNAYGSNSCEALFKSTVINRNAYVLSNKLEMDSALIEKQLAIYNIQESPDLAYLSLVPKHPDLAAHARNIVQQVNAINPNWASLILHPGILQRSKEFLQFLQTADKSLSAMEVYCLFRDKLGFRFVYRGLALRSLEDVKAIQKDGLLATSLKRDLFKNDQPIATYQQQIINRERMKNSEQDHLISVSEYPDLSYALATSFGNPAKHTLVAVFKIRIPVIDLIDAGPKGLIQMIMFSGQEKFVGTTQSGGYFDKIIDEKIESFVPFAITSDEIVEVTIYNDGQIGKTSGMKIVPNDFK